MSRYAYGKIVSIIVPSDERVKPECPEFFKCGGCQLMHMSYSAQVALKRGIVEDAFSRIGKMDIKVDEVIGCDRRIRYRNKMIFPVGQNENGEIDVGFYAQRSHRIIPVSDCKLGSGICSDIIGAVKKYMLDINIDAYDEAVHRGVVRRIFVRTAKTGETMVVVSVNARFVPREGVLVENIRSVSDKIVSIILNINMGRNNAVLGERNRILWGKEVISEYLCGIRYDVSPQSFFQINTVQTEKLYGKVIEYAGLSSKETVLDIYCGAGSISLCAAKYAKSVIGVEVVGQAVEDAMENAADNNIKNCKFYSGSAEEIVPELVGDGICPDVVILDPPRKGSDNRTLDAIVLSGADRVVYVSCNPATLARDVRFLADSGYAVERVAAVDMFPNTRHVETVVLITRVKE